MRRNPEKFKKAYAELEKDLQAEAGWPTLRCPPEKGQGLTEMASWIVILITIAVTAALFFFTGCTVQQPKPVPLPVAEVAVTPPPVAPVPVMQQPVFVPPTGGRPLRVYRRMPVAGPGSKVIDYQPGTKYTLGCTEFGTITIKFPAGEQIKKWNNGASGEWMIEQTSMGMDLPMGVITLRRAPFAPTNELQVITDAEVYQFILVPKSGGVSKEQLSVYIVTNRETEARQAENHQRHLEAQEQERQAYEIRPPRLDAEHLRSYTFGGDRVAWMPVSVEGDQKQTVIKLPASTGADLPMFTIIEDGKEIRVNTRTLPEDGNIGPRIVVDQPFTEARLIGAGGSVSIISTSQREN